MRGHTASLGVIGIVVQYGADEAVARGSEGDESLKQTYMKSVNNKFKESQEFTIKVKELPDGTFQANSPNQPDLGKFKNTDRRMAVEDIKRAMYNSAANGKIVEGGS